MPFPRSLAITSGISVDVFSLSYLDVSVRSVRWSKMDHWFINRVYPEGNPQIKRGIVLFSVVNLRNIDYLTWLFVFVNVLFSKCLGLRFLSLCLNFPCCPLFGLITRSTSGDHNIISGHHDVYKPNSRIELETFCLQNKCSSQLS